MKKQKKRKLVKKKSIVAKKTTLKTKLKPEPKAKFRWTRILAMLGVLLFVICLVFATISWKKEQDLNSELNNQLITASINVAQNLDSNMYQRFLEIEELAKTPELLSSQSLQRREILKNIKNVHPEYAWLGIADTTGKVIVATDGMLEKQDVRVRPWYKGAQEKTFVGDAHESSVLEKLLINDSGAPLRFIDISTPLVDKENKKVGVLGAHLYWSWIIDLKETSLKAANISNTEVLVLARDGTVLGGPTDLEGKKLQFPILSTARAGGTGSIIQVWPDGKQYRTAFASTKGYETYPGLGWLVIVRKPL